ncbi:hypothetical protein Dimus_021323 [Dionaea muscipula]
MEDSNLMTIEYLRARLHSERSVSKAARERADELAKRVEELEEQLEIVTLQRKRAEKVALDALAVLESRIGEISEALYPGLEEDEAIRECSMSKGNLVMEGEREGGGEGEGEFSGKTELKEDEKQELWGAEEGSTPSTGRTSSLKSRMQVHQSSVKKDFDTSLRKRNQFVQTGSSSLGRCLGRSCRQIQRGEIRSVVEGSRYESTDIDSKDSDASGSPSRLDDCLDSGPEEFEGHSENWNEKVLVDDQVSRTFESQGPDHEFDGEMDRALKRQAQLIDCYEAQEKAQREWEEKHRESQNSTPDLCEPGNQSDVTEERVEMKSSEAMYTTTSSGRNSEKAADNFSKEPSSVLLNSFKRSPRVNLESSEGPKLDELLPAAACRAPAPDFAFSMVDDDDDQMMQHHASPGNIFFEPSGSTQTHPSSPGSSHGIGSHTLSSSAASANNRTLALDAEAPENGCQSCYALVPHNGRPPRRFEQVLDSLGYVKSLLKQEYSSSSSSSWSGSGGSNGREIEPFVSARRDDDLEILRIPVSSAALYRVPTDFESESDHIPPRGTRLLAPGGDQYLRRATAAMAAVGPSTSGIDPIYNSAATATPPRVSTQHQQQLRQPPLPWLDLVPHMPPNQVTPNHSSSGAAGGMPSSTVSLYHNGRVGPNMSR